MDYKVLKGTIDTNYPVFLREQEEWMKKHWELFDSQKARLEAMVGQEFGNVLHEIGPLPLPDWILERQPAPENPKILGYKTKYFPQSRNFMIEVTRFKLPNGKIMDNADVLSSQYGCPHVFLGLVCGWSDEIHPRIKKFKEEYSVSNISYPVNDCKHK